MMNKQLDTLLAPALTHLGYEYWGLEQRQEGRRSIFCIYIDKPGGVNLDDCAKASSDLSALLEAESDLSEAYVLEISSPGIERPLFSLMQYQRFIGQMVSVKLHDKIAERRLWQGLLTAVTDKEIVSKITLLELNATHIDLPDDSVDSVLCMRLMHHIHDPQHRLIMYKEMQRVARHTVCISNWVDGNYKSYREHMRAQK